MSVEATEAVVEAAPPADAPEGGDTTVVVAVEGSAPEPEGEPEGGDTTVVVVEETAGAEAAQDDATNLDHEQRITRLEEQLGQVRSEVLDRPTYESVQSMIPSYESIAETAASVAGTVAAEVVEDIAEDGDVDGGVVAVQEPDGTVDVLAIDPQAPPVNEPRRRGSSLFTW